MKLTAFTIFLTVIFNIGTYGQITMSLTRQPMEVFISQVQKQTDYNFVFLKEDISNADKVTIQVRNETLARVLQLCFEQQQKITYAIKDKMIIIRKNAVKEKRPDVKNTAPGSGSRRSIGGKVVNESNEPIPSASVFDKRSGNTTITDSQGAFSLLIEDPTTLRISNIGYETVELRTAGKSFFQISLKKKVTDLKEVTVNYNTGYQQISKERATGSFEYLNKEELNRRTGMDILSRLEGLTSSVLIDKRGLSGSQNSIGASNIIIRGVGTLSDAMKKPLIVLNNLPYEGDISSINPNDVDNITILKDAAAAAIWGAKAGNGVIVITTKKGQFNQSTKVTFNVNTEIMQKPDLFYLPRMSSSDFIDVEQFLFSKGFYDGILNNKITWPAVSPVVEILEKERIGLISGKDAIAQVDALRGIDVRNDFKKYIYRTGISQQYALNISGGSDQLAYYLSGGYDKSNSPLRGNQVERITLRSESIFQPFKDLELNAGIGYAHNKITENSLGELGSPGYNYRYEVGTTQQLYPYAQFADQNGKHLPIARQYREGYTDTAGRGMLYNWKYYPLDEINYHNNTGKSNDLNINLIARYKIAKPLKLEVRYQYEKSFSEFKRMNSDESYYTRNLINLYSQLEDGSVKYIIPEGSILYVTNRTMTSHAGNAQINFNKIWSSKHNVSFIAGGEIRESSIFSNSILYYGYNPNNLSVADMDYLTFFPNYGGRDPMQVPGLVDPLYEVTNRYVSAFSTASYLYNNKYSASLSARRDASNLFGAKTNDKWKPFWSIGGAWIISNESFFTSRHFSFLKLRGTFGYQGNVNNSVSPFTIIQYSPASASLINQPYADIFKPGNPGLTWEKVQQLNVGLDYSVFKDRLSGSFEFFRKKSYDVILATPLDPTTGIDGSLKNSAYMTNSGIEMNLNAGIIAKNSFKWNSEIVFSYVKSKVTDYLIDDRERLIGAIVSGDGTQLLPVKGIAPYAIYSLPFAGLDPENGDPIGYLGKTDSKDYMKILNQIVDTANIVYHGSAIPTYFGTLNNIFTYRNFSLLFSISYKFGYYFRKPTISYFNLIGSGNTHADYAKRWQKPGDEAFTTVPSMIYPDDTYGFRDLFYGYSSVNVLKGDHLRLEYVRFNYNLTIKNRKYIPLQNIQVYAMASNLGILWRANKEKIDPDYATGNIYPLQRRFTVGLKLEF